MDSRPPNLLLVLLLLTSVLHFGQYAKGQALYTIDTVGLTILPSSPVKSGTPVILRCEVSVSHDPSLHLMHTFQFLRYDVPVHSLTTGNTTVEYEINPARAADSGAYECRVTIEWKKKGSLVQTLTVEGLQSPILNLSKTTLFESEELLATCSAPNEKGALIFRFYQEFRSGVTEMIKQVGPSGNSSETKLVLRQVGDSILYCNYNIPMNPDAGHSNFSNKVQVIVKGLYILPVMNVIPSTNVYEGDIIEVVCRVVSPPRNVEVFLTKDKSILKQASVSLNHRMTVQAGDSGELVCKAEWNSVQKEDYVTLSVKELFSEPELTLDPMDIFEGESFTLFCSVTIYSPERITNETIQFSIYRNGVQLIEIDTYSAIADPSKNGNYTCKAQATTLRNNFLVKMSKTFVVKAKVPVSDPMLSVVGGRLVLGKPFQVLCHSETGSLPITYTLYGPDRKPDVKVVSRPGDWAIFTTPALQKSSDISKFLCHAKNNKINPPKISSTHQLEQRTEIIEPVSKPDLIVQPNFGYVSEGQDLTLVCSVARGTLPINFTWYRTESQGSLATQISTGPKGSHKIKGVRGEHSGGYYCVSNNQANEVKRSSTVTVGVKWAAWKKGLIAVGCILLIGALVFFIAFKKGVLPFMRKRTGGLSVKSASTKTERLSLTLAEANEAANVTPGVMGRSVWSEHVSGSESDDQNSVASPECPEPQYTEVQTKQADPCAVPVMKGTETVYSEVRNSKQEVPEDADGHGSVEYVQLNHDTDCHSHHSNHSNHSNHGEQNGHADDTNNSSDTNATNAIDPGDCAV